MLTTDAAISCYFLSLCDGDLKASTTRTYLTAVNNMHTAKGFAKPAVGPLTAKLRKGWSRIVADKTNSLAAARGPVSPKHVWDNLTLTTRTADPEWRRQLTAIFLCFLVCRCKVEVLELQLQDIFGLEDGASHINVNRYKNAEGCDDPRRLVFPVARDRTVPEDLALALMIAMRAAHVAESAQANCLIFCTQSVHCAPTTDDLSSRIHAPMAEHGADIPPCVLSSSYSCPSGGATALYVIDVPIVAVAAMLSPMDNETHTAISKKVAILAPFYPAALRLCGHWLRCAP